MAAAAVSSLDQRRDQQPGSPEWWLSRLYPKLVGRAQRMRQMDDYYTGDHPLPFLTKSHDAKMRNEFRKLLDASRSNFMRLVIDACEERLLVDGFRLSAETDETADAATWKNIWQANNMDSESQTAFLEAMVKSVSYLSVWSGDPYPVIAVEDPTETIVAYTPGSNFRRRDAALKVWRDEALGVRRANVYLPDAIVKFQAPLGNEPKRSATVADAQDQETTRWERLPDGDVERNQIGVVSIVPLRNRPRLLVEGEPELGDVVAIQDRINGVLFMRGIAGYVSAHRQRVLTGVPIMEDDKGRPTEPFDAAVDRLWQLENPEAKVFDLAQTDLSGYIDSIEQDVGHIAITTRTPKHYMLPTGQEPSGDAIKSAEAGLVKKVERKQRTFGEGLEEAVRLARLFDGQTDVGPDAEIVWKAAATPTVAEVTDAVVKEFQAGLIDHATALEKLGYSQTNIRRIMSGSAQDALRAALAQPQPPVAA